MDATRQTPLPGQWRTTDTRARVGDAVTVANGLGLSINATRIALREKEQMDIQKTVGASLRQARESKGITQEALAAKAETSLTYIKLVELGHKNITIQQLWRIAEAMGCTTADLKIR